MVGLHGVRAKVLQRTRTALVEQSYASTFLPKIEQYTSALVRDLPDRGLQLGATVTPQAHKAIAGQAFGMNARQHRPAIIDGAQDESEMLAAARLITKRVHREVRMCGRQRTRCDAQVAYVAQRSCARGSIRPAYRSDERSGRTAAGHSARKRARDVRTHTI